MISAISDCIEDNNLMDTFISIISDTNIKMQEGWLRPDIYLARMMSDWNPENWLFVLWIEGVVIESLLIKKSNNEKYNFEKSSIIFIFQDLTAIKEAIAFNCRKLKGTFILQSYYNRNGMINVKREWQKLTSQNLIYEEVIDFDVGEIYLDLS